jgi:hypothetical protein
VPPLLPTQSVAALQNCVPCLHRSGQPGVAEWRIALDIEKSLTINKDGESVEEWMDVGNGCICCSVK